VNYCLKSNNITPQHDQFLINDYANGNFSILKPEMNAILYRDINEYNNKIIIAHFASSKKPMYNNCNNHLYQTWYDAIKNNADLRPYPSLKQNDYIGILVYKNTNNVGDWYQTTSALYMWWKYINSKNTFREFLIKCIYSNKIENYNICWIERDNISKTIKPLNCDRVIILFNGWFMHKNNNNVFDFPPPDWILPIYTSVHINYENILNDVTVDHFQKHEPIGCRDLDTLNLLNKYNIQSYFTGCLTILPDFSDSNFGFSQTVDYSNDILNIDYSISDKVGINLTQNIKNDDDKYWIVKSMQNVYNYSFAKEIITSRLHIYSPLKFNNANVTLYNKKTKKAFTSNDKDHSGKINRFAGLFDIINEKSINIKNINREILFYNTISNIVDAINS